MTTPPPPPPGTHPCALAPACPEVIPLALLMCRPHWALVSPALQKAVYRAFKTRREAPDAFRAAVQAAVAAARRGPGGAP